MIYDVLIIGGGAAGMSCALVLGSAKIKPFATNKKIGIIMHQKASALQTGLFNNVLGIASGTTGIELLSRGKQQLKDMYPHVDQIEKEKVQAVNQESEFIMVKTNKKQYNAKKVVVAVGPSNLFNIDGLMEYIEPHEKLPVAKGRIQLKNNDHLVVENIYVAGVLAGWRSQFAIACGSGASVATDILTEWNNGIPTMVHDKVE